MVEAEVVLHMYMPTTLYQMVAQGSVLVMVANHQNTYTYMYKHMYGGLLVQHLRTWWVPQQWPVSFPLSLTGTSTSASGHRRTLDRPTCPGFPPLTWSPSLQQRSWTLLQIATAPLMGRPCHPEQTSERISTHRNTRGHTRWWNNRRTSKQTWRYKK